MRNSEPWPSVDQEDHTLLYDTSLWLGFMNLETDAFFPFSSLRSSAKVSWITLSFTFEAVRQLYPLSC